MRRKFKYSVKRFSLSLCKLFLRRKKIIIDIFYKFAIFLTYLYLLDRFYNILNPFYRYHLMDIYEYLLILLTFPVALFVILIPNLFIFSFNNRGVRKSLLLTIVFSVALTMSLTVTAFVFVEYFLIKYVLLVTGYTLFSILFFKLSISITNFKLLFLSIFLFSLINFNYVIFRYHGQMTVPNERMLDLLDDKDDSLSLIDFQNYYLIDSLKKALYNWNYTFEQLDNLYQMESLFIDAILSDTSLTIQNGAKIANQVQYQRLFVERYIKLREFFPDSIFPYHYDHVNYLNSLKVFSIVNILLGNSLLLFLVFSYFLRTYYHSCYSLNDYGNQHSKKMQNINATVALIVTILNLFIVIYNMINIAK